MPGIVDGRAGNKKRKRSEIENAETAANDPHAEILRLENQIAKSRQHYNNIKTLIEYAQAISNDDTQVIAAAVALCRVFCRLWASGDMTINRETSKHEIIVTRWLKRNFDEYRNILLGFIASESTERSTTALTLFMRLIKAQGLQAASDNIVWRDSGFEKLLQSLATVPTALAARTEFLENYFLKFDDVRFFTFSQLNELASGDNAALALDGIISMLSIARIVPETEDDLKSFFISRSKKKKNDLLSPIAHKRRAQAVWMAVLNHSLNNNQRKVVLELMSRRIAPWFLQAELLMDFLTDSFNAGGSMSLRALSGLFYLIQEKNLDYPQFYPKLYSLLDASILHSKHRSLFFRLLDTFLASTHLPAALVASFIKRLSRLTLHAPPSGVVIVVPLIYNLLKHHPTCTFMIHREISAEPPTENAANSVWGDPFLVEEPDPMKTNAIESSLWEIQMLQSHYHPNVATIAKIISEQFTKQVYNLEDFLDHSYGSMLDAELSKVIKKPPEVEYEIPQKVLQEHDRDSEHEDSLLLKLWDFG